MSPPPTDPKQRVREDVWDHLEDAGIARFPFPPHGRIPNFDGARDAAERLASLPEWQDAAAIKANPDSPQLPARRNALHMGKTLYMAVPRLRDEDCFVELDPADVGDLDAAPTVSHMDDHGVRVGPDELPPIDCILSGSVAVATDGTRIGKGEGFSDLEYAVLRELGAVDDATPVVTTIHDGQVVDPVDAPAADSHDVLVDVIVTPNQTIRTGARGKLQGVDWNALSDEQLAEMPVLQRLHDGVL